MNTPENTDFEKYLEEVCFKANPTVLDDDMPDAFDAWLSEMQVDDLITYANVYAHSLLTAQREKEELMYERGVVETEERIREGVEKLRVKKPLYDTHTSYNVAIEDVLSTLNK